MLRLGVAGGSEFGAHHELLLELVVLLLHLLELLNAALDLRRQRNKASPPLPGDMQRENA